jgi:hypothetical protein
MRRAPRQSPGVAVKPETKNRGSRCAAVCAMRRRRASPRSPLIGTLLALYRCDPTTPIRITAGARIKPDEYFELQVIG